MAWVTARRVWIIPLALVLAAVVVVAGCEQQETQAAHNEEAAMDEGVRQETEVASGEIMAVTEDTFEAQVLQSSVPVLVDFTADWCPPCRMLHPTLEKIADEYAGRLRVVQVNVDQAPGLANKYGVRSIPALFVISEGKVVAEAVGLQPEAELKAMLDPHID
ncbi:MAG: thioredoxin [Armatimonadota bacterium]